MDTDRILHCLGSTSVISPISSVTSVARRIEPARAQPRAMGRVGSEIHSLHDPTYNFDPTSPACSIASRLAQAGDARTALVHDVAGRRRAEQLLEFFPQLPRRTHGQIRIQIGLKKTISRRRDSPRHPVDGLDLTAVTLRRPRVDDHALAGMHASQHLCRVDPCGGVGLWRHLAARSQLGHGRFKRISIGHPFRNSTIEYCHVDETNPPGQPPQTRRILSAHVIIRDNLRGRGHAVPFQKRRKVPGAR